MTELAIIAGLLLAIALGAIVIVRVVRIRRVSLLDWSLMGIAGVYGVGWSLVVAVTTAGGNPLWESWILGNVRHFPTYVAAVPLLGFAVWLGWISLTGFLDVPRLLEPVRITPSHRAVERLRLCAWFMLATGVLLQIAYSYVYGGPLGVLEHSARIRSATSDIVNPFGFLRPFTGLALLASFVFFGLMLVPASRRPWTGFLLSTGFSIYLLYSWLGRIAFLAYLATFVLAGGMRAIRDPLKALLGGAAVLATILVGAYHLSAALDLKFTAGLHNYLAVELSFPFASFLGHAGADVTPNRWFVDLAAAPLYLLPSSVWSRWVGDVAHLNTAMILGAPKGESGVTGEIPVDLLTLGWLQAEIAGVVIVGFAFGFFLRICQDLVGRIPHAGVRLVLEAHLALKIAVLGIFYAQPALAVKNNIVLLAGAVILGLFLTGLHRVSTQRGAGKLTASDQSAPDGRRRGTESLPGDH